MIYVDDELLPPIYFNDPKTGKLSEDAYFVIRRELPHKYQMEYLDAAISFELELFDEENEEGEDSKLKAETNKLKVSQVTDILMNGGLVEIVGVIEKKTDKPIGATEWKRLPSSLMGQITKAIQQTAKADSKKKGKKRPN